jgi:glycosyltransferase involved in cell wall biosynthesis
MISVLHIDTGRIFRGGQRQVYLLLKNLQYGEIRHYLACPQESPLRKKAASFVQDYFSLSKSNFGRIFQKGKLDSFISKNNIQLIHAHDSHAHSLAALLKRKSNFLRLIVTRRSAGHIGFTGRAKYLLPYIKYIAISRYIQNLLQEGGVPASSIAIIPDMIEPILEFVSSEKKPNSPRKIISVGVLDRGKGFDIVLSAINLLRNERDDFRLALLGDGRERRNLERFIAERHLFDIVDIMGWREETSTFLKEADLYLSASSSEGLGIALIEAMGAGLSVVASDIPPYRELIDNGYNGMLFESGNVDSLVEKLRYALDNPELMTVMGKCSYKKALEFRAGLIVERIYRLYCETANKSLK